MMLAKALASASASTPKIYVEDVFSTYLYTGNGSTQTIINNISLGDSVRSLAGKTITNLGSAFNSSYPLSNINDNIAETSNGANIAYNQGTFDIYVDLESPTVVTAYLLAPQGIRGSTVYNTPTAFIVYASNDASSWTTITTVSSISTGYPNWNAGDFRTFSFSNSTAYRYWRLSITSSSDPGNIAISEWQVTGTQSGAGKGGLVWLKSRGLGYNHALFDTSRGASSVLSTESTSSAGSTGWGSFFNSNGFTVQAGGPYNESPNTYASWTFRKAPKFFDVVTYTGTGADQTISHNLGSTPGCIIVKRTDTTGDWYVYHRSLTTATQNWITLNTTGAANGAIGQDLWGPPTSTTFKVDTYLGLSTSGGTYVAYLFAHDAGGFGDSGNESVVKCGSFTTDGSGNATVDLGWEPQWVLIKSSGSTGNWLLVDNMRGWSAGNDAFLYANTSGAELTGADLGECNSTGFSVKSLGATASLIYIAIRRGPMKTPTDATKVFSAITGISAPDTSMTVGFPADMYLATRRGESISRYVQDRLRGFANINATGTPNLFTDSTAAEATNQSVFAYNLWNTTAVAGNQTGNANSIWYYFRRAPGFCDVVAYAGTGSARTVSHNLGVAPELMIIKRRSGGTGSWVTYASGIGNTAAVFLDGTSSTNTSSAWFNNTSPTSGVFTVGTSVEVNASASTYIAYLFATCPGVSKVGSYTGTGTTLNVDCGFTAGARFVLIKRRDSTGDWYVWDTARGIVSGNDPYLLLNSTAAEVTNTDYIDPLSSGFQISSTAPAAINALGGSFIFLAIA